MPFCRIITGFVSWSVLFCAATVLSATPLLTLDSKACRLAVSNGVIVRFNNRLCGETLVRPVDDVGRLSGLHRLNQPDLRLEAGEQRPSMESKTRLGWEATWDEPSGPEAAQLQSWMEVDAASGDILVKQNGRLATNGLVGAFWGIASVPDELEVLVPGCSGQRFGANAPAGRRTFEYPLTWEAPFVLIQGRRGGVIVWAEDASLRFRSLMLEHCRRAFRLQFESRNLAPFEDKASVSGRWRMRAYAGNWQAGAAIYRQWAAARFQLAPLEKKDPAWARQIRFVVILGLDQSLLSALAAKCNPAQTLLYVPSWRKDGYDRNYPDYTATPTLAPFMAEAHRLGFRVMLHVNYFGCDPKNPLYESLKQWQIRDPFSGELKWWEWPAKPPIKFAYINPASRTWRQTLVERLVEVAALYSVDALHLDQTLCIYNDKNGLIDGLNCIEGNLALHRELRQALPEVALSGEGLNEITSQCEHFAQRHVWSMDHVHRTWDDRQIAMSHPISSAVLAPYTQIYGYLGMANPADAPFFTVWRQAYEHWGVLPTCCRPNQSQLDTLPAPVAAVLEQARFFQSKHPKPDFETLWQSRDVFVYRLADGGQARFVQDQGVALEAQQPGQKPQILERRLEGVSEVRLPGSVLGWLAFDAKRIIGLNPEQAYSWSPLPREASTPHLSRLPAGYVLSRCGLHEDFARFQIIRSPADEAKHTITLWNYAGPVTGGVRLASGETRILGGLEFMDDQTAGSVHPDGDGLFAHPPWQHLTQQPGNQQNITFVEFPLKLPDRPRVFFTSGVQLRHGAEGKSDGVTFKVTATCAGAERGRSVHHSRQSPGVLDLDLSCWRGKSILLHLEVDPGPAGSVTFDWGRFVRPRIAVEEADTPVQQTVRLAGFAPPEAVLAAVGEVRLASSSAKRGARAEMRGKCVLPNTLIVPINPPIAAALPTDLLQCHFSSRVVFGNGIEQAGYSHTPAATAEAKCGGESRRALSASPPRMGKSLADWWLKLPETPARLVTEIGIGDGAPAKGTTFAIEVNGRKVFEQAVEPDAGWVPVEINLAQWKGQPVALTLLAGSFEDAKPATALWAEPRLVSESQ